MKQNYKALTRTYRPLTFDDIVSQEHVSNTLKNAIKQNRLSHAYMFCGPRGVGKTTMARVLARVVNEVDSGVDGESLNQTLNIVEMDAASNRKIEDVRSLKEVIRVPPQSGKYKIFIIDEVHMLTKEAFNALLKTLEEPPSHAIFIFATTEPHKVLPTILSRVQRFDFKRISVREIVQRLKVISEKEHISIDDESIHVIAKRADGALRDALGLMDQAIAFCGDTIEYSELLKALNVVDTDHLFSFVDVVQKRDSNAGLSLIRDLLNSGTDIQEFLVSLTEHIRNLYVANNESRLHLLEATDETKKRYSEQSSSFTEEDLMRVLHIVSEAQLKIKDVQQPQVHFEIMMLKLVHMHRTTELNELIERLDLLKKNSRNQGGTGEPNPETRIDVEKESDSQEDNSDKVPEKSRDEVNEEPVAVDTDQVETQDIFGSSSLGKSSESTTVQNGSDTLMKQEGPKTSVELKKIEDVIKIWDKFLSEIQSTLPQMLYFQIQRVNLDSLDGRILTVSVDNEFANKMVEENRQVLSNLFKNEFGIPLQMKCYVKRNQNMETDSLNPYERFKQLQQKDPHIRTLVELFGAELEY